MLLVQKYKEDFKNSVKCLRTETENSVQNALCRAIDVREGLERVNEIKNTQKETIERAVLELLQTCREKKVNLSIEDLDQKFERMWEDNLVKLSSHKLEARVLQKEIFNLLQKSLLSKMDHLKADFKKCFLDHYGTEEFTVDVKWFPNIEEPCSRQAHTLEVQEICNNIIVEIKSSVSDIVSRKTDFHCSYIEEILRQVDDKMKQCEMGDECEIALKLHICDHAVREFQAMHNRFIEMNSPQKLLEQSKSKFKEEFKDFFQKRDQCQKKAEEFVEEFLKPAVQDYVTKKLGQGIADEVMNSEIGKEYSTATLLQYALLKQMLQEDKYENYKAYIGSYESFVKERIKTQTEQILSKDGKLAMLQKRYLSDIVKKITDTVTLLTVQADESTDIKAFIKGICTDLKDQLVFSKDFVDSFLTLNSVKIKAFSDSLGVFIEKMKDSMTQLYEESTNFNTEQLPFKPHDIIFQSLCGCGRQCPFCGAPCEAGGKEHSEHFSSMHRPKGLKRYQWIESQKLVVDICSSLVKSSYAFRSQETNNTLVPSKDYRNIYPDWKIKGDAKVEATDYWKYVLMKYNKEFARDSKAQPADIPQGWAKLTQQQALESLGHSFNIQH